LADIVPNVVTPFTAAGIALDAPGNVYIAVNGPLHKLNRAAANGVPFATNMTFPPTAAGTKSAVQFATLQNIGTSNLTFSPAPLAAGGSNPNVTAPFEMNSTSTICATPSALIPSATCSLAFDFAPPLTATGLSTGTATVTDNSLNVTGATQIVPMSGTTVQISISPYLLPDGTVGTAYPSQTFTVNGDANATAPYALTNTAISPAGSGLSVSTYGNTGTISGTPTAAGTYNFVLTVTDSSSPQIVVNQPYTVTINPAPVVANVTVASKTYDGTTATTVTGCTLTPQVTGVTCSYTGATANFADANAGTNKQAAVTSGVSLQGTGLANYTLTNIIASPSTINAKAITVTATAANKTADGTTTATITGCGVSTAGGVLTADMGNVTCSYSAASGTFADATVGNGKTVTVTGLTLTGTKAGNYSITMPVTTTANIMAPTTTMTPPNLSSLPNPVLNTSYSQSLAVTGGTAPITYSYTGTLPPGLSLNPSTGVLSGTPTTAGTYTFTVTAKDSGSPQQSVTYPASPGITLTVAATPADFVVSVTSATSQTVSTSGGSAAYTINVKSTTGTTYSNSVTLSASGQPSGAPTPSFSLNPVTPGANGATSTLTITLPTATASVRSYSPIAFALLLLPVVLIGKARSLRNLRIRGLLAVVLALVATAGIIGCGGGGDKTTQPVQGTKWTAGTYTITITGNDANHTAKATLIVQ